MATAWRFVAYYALPVPLMLMVLLNVPAPRRVMPDMPAPSCLMGL